MALPIIGNIIDRVIDKGASLISEVITDKDEAARLEHEWRQQLSRESHEFQKIEIEAERDLALAQIATNTEEAKSNSLFVAGARPAIMWICGAALAWSYIIQGMVEWVAFLAGFDIGEAPRVNAAELMPILVGMLGLGTMRSFEKTRGVETTSIK